MSKKAKGLLFAISIGSFAAASFAWFTQPSMPKTSNQLGLPFEGKVAPNTWTFRDDCLAYKCGSDGRVADGRTLLAFANYEMPDDSINIPAGTPFKYKDQVSVTLSPGKLVATTAFIAAAGYRISSGDIVYSYAEWGEGCITAWHQGRGFAFRDAPDNGKNKSEIDCLGTSDGSTWSFREAEPWKGTVWTYAEFLLEGRTLKLYFSDYDDVTFD